MSYLYKFILYYIYIFTYIYIELIYSALISEIEFLYIEYNFIIIYFDIYILLDNYLLSI